MARAKLSQLTYADLHALPDDTVLEREDGQLATTVTASGDQPVAVGRPFPLTVVPADLAR
jgi:hypothetical protein